MLVLLFCPPYNYFVYNRHCQTIIGQLMKVLKTKLNNNYIVLKPSVLIVFKVYLAAWQQELICSANRWLSIGFRLRLRSNCDIFINSKFNIVSREWRRYEKLKLIWICFPCRVIGTSVQLSNNCASDCIKLLLHMGLGFAEILSA